MVVNFQAFVYIVSISGYTPRTSDTFFNAIIFWGVWTLQTAEIHVDVAPPGSSICITEAQLQLDDPWARTQQKGGEVFENLSQHDPT